MPYTALSDVAQPIGVTQASSGSQTTSSYFSLASYERMAFLVSITGMPAVTNTVTVVVIQATNSAGTGNKALSPAKAITALAGTNANTLVMINVAGPELDTNNSFTYAAVQVTGAAAAGTNVVATIIALGDPQATPPTLQAGVTQIVL